MIQNSKLKILLDVGRVDDLVIMKNNKHEFYLFCKKIVIYGKMAITFSYELEKMFNI
jgi:hypothetical protein